jgi:2',3'-cyclic-nucleotide 2'-phosphodiesterase/3'-nucleotidase/5'-nucleotidase
MKNFIQLFFAATAGIGFMAVTAGAAAPNISLTWLSSVEHGDVGNRANAAMIVAHDVSTQRIYVADPLRARVDVLDISNPAMPQLLRPAALDLTPYNIKPTSVTAFNGLLAVAGQDATAKVRPGSVLFFDANFTHLATVQVGALPDMITFTPNGHKVLVANEGEPNHYFQPGDEGFDPADPSIDPEGSVGIIDVSGLGSGNAPTLHIADFHAFDGFTREQLFSDSNGNIRVFGPRASVSQDLEPEYITVSQDSKTAWVTLQENNAVAMVDIPSATVTALIGLGTKNHNAPNAGLDASDQDGPPNASGVGTARINIQPWPVKGLYLPDGIASYRVKGEDYIVHANEGDARDYSKVIPAPTQANPSATKTVGFTEVSRVAQLSLDPIAFPDAATLKLPANLGRLQVTNVNGKVGSNYTTLYSFGARSFTIRKASGELVWDSGDQIEQITAALDRAAAADPSKPVLLFNASHDSNIRDSRSPSKGPEPEPVIIGKAFGRTYAFVGLERVGGIFVYDISNPFAPEFQQYINRRDFTKSVTTRASGDLGPEGMVLIDSKESPNGKPLLVVGNELSGTTTIFEINRYRP